jgi:GNAT superfamily N-acetyltransferase
MQDDAVSLLGSRAASPVEDKAMALELLDNIVWHTLNGAHAACSVGSHTARRYAAGYTPIVGFADNERPDFAALRAYCAPGEQFYCGGWSGPVPGGWDLHEDETMVQMVWNAPMPGARQDFAPTRLESVHAAAMLDLVALTNPGPFGPRTLELGEYHGIFDGPHLVAMAGERMRAGRLHEISAVCTHPQYEGRGLARALVETLLRQQMQRDELPFLHVMRTNHGARRLYARMGFLSHKEIAVRVVSC